MIAGGVVIAWITLERTPERSDHPLVVSPNFEGGVPAPPLGPQELESVLPSHQPAPRLGIELGSIAVIDEFRTTHNSESGFLEIRRVALPSALSTRIEVVRGEWDPSQVPDGEHSIDRITLGGREAIPANPSSFSLNGKKPTALLTRWLASATLHVVEASSGRELDDVTVYVIDGISASSVELPIEVNGARILGTGLASPISLEPITRTVGAPSVFARRPGFAWGQLALDRTGGGDQYIRLTPGGDLRVDIRGGVPPLDVTVRLWRERRTEELLAERSFHKPSQGTPRVEFSGLVPGTYEVTLEKGAKRQATVMAEQTVRIEGGHDTAIELPLSALPAEASAMVTLRVVIDANWNLENFTAVLTDLDAPTRTPGRSKHIRCGKMTFLGNGTYVTEQFKVRCGRYEIYINEARFGVEQYVSAAPEGQELRIEVPPPVQVGVTVVDAETMEVVAKPSLCWSAVKLDGSPSGVGCSSVPASAPGRIEFRAPVGKIQLLTSAGALDKYLSDFRTIDITPDAQEVIVELDSGALLTLALREGERDLEWSPTTIDKLVFRSPWGVVRPRRTSMESKSGLLTCLFAEPGKYVMSVPQIPGYLPTEDMQVDVTKVDRQVRVVSLTRQQH